MEQLLFFGLGVTTVCAVAGVVAMFRSQQKIADMQMQVDDLESWLEDTNDSLQNEVDELDKQLDAGKTVGCQVGVFHLPYFPKEYRFSHILFRYVFSLQ